MFEIGDDGRVDHQGRFDEDDFEGAYRELERRYYAGEGAAFAEAGAIGTEWLIALNRRRLRPSVRASSAPPICASRTGRARHSAIRSGERTARQLRGARRHGRVVADVARRSLRWVSPTVVVARFEREAVGQDGEQYSWTRLMSCEVRDGRVASMCEFELDDEEAAFAYAEERMRATTSRLAVTNRACEIVPAFLVRDASPRCRRRRRGATRIGLCMTIVDESAVNPFAGVDAMRAASRVSSSSTPISSHACWRFAGERLHLVWSRWSNDDGNETTTLYVNETGEDGRVFYHGRFDEDDFESAYRELERRYYAGEGAAFAEGGRARDRMGNRAEPG